MANTIVALISVIILIIILWVIPINSGLKWAKIKGVSKLWMLFGIHPILGWITYFVLRYGIDPRKQCDKCKESIKLEAQICRYCGNQMSEEQISHALKGYHRRSR